MKSKFYDKIILSIEDSIEKQKQIRKELRIKNTGITEPLESEKFFSNYWPTTILENVVSVRGRIGFHGLTRIDYRDTGPILLSVGNISNDGKLTFKNTTHIHDKAFKRSPNIIVEKNDILLSKSGTIGKVCLTEEIKEKLTINAAINIFRCGNLLLPKYLFYWFKSPATQALLDKLAPGIAQRNLFQRELRRLSIPIPTLEFQNTLIIKIEELFSKIDSTKQLLEHTKLQLEQYRQSLLKFAFEGKLTEEWREINKNRLELIIPENKNYEIMDLHGWISCSIGDLIKLSKEKFEPLKGENKILLGLEHIEKHTGRIIGQDNSKNTKSTKTVFRSGDVLYGRLRPYFNKITIPDFDGVCSTDILVFQETTNILNKFLKYFLMQGSFVKFTNQNMTGVGLPRISFGKISEFMIQLPSLMEQEQIVSQIEQSFSLIENTSQIVESSLQNLQTMKMSVLKQAFEGKLVLQDPNDEPASVLLERIKLKN